LLILNVPTLRFPGFKDEWSYARLGDTCEINPRSETLPNSFVYIDLESVSSGILLKEDIVFKNNAPSRAQRLLKKGDVLFQMVRPYQKNNLYFDLEGNYVASTGYAQLRTKFSSQYLFQYLQTQKFVDKVIERCTGTSYPAINSTDLSNIQISLPSNEEQIRIAKFLSLIDERIITQNKIIEELKLLKSTLCEMLYSNFQENYETETCIGDLIYYLQPTNYLVSNTEYSKDKSLVPVLTANKSFILGYSNETEGICDLGECIIFDDFTMDMKFVDFPFKVKSSAIKILKPKLGSNIRFLYYYLKYLKFNSAEHKRHYISEVEPMVLKLPNKQAQQKISNLMKELESKLSCEIDILNNYSKQKSYLLTNLLSK